MRRSQPLLGKTSVWRLHLVCGLCEVAPLWLLGAAQTEVVLSLGIPEFLLSIS